ncbi:MAG: hypothetical protein JWN36_1661 [Microbacteriaceae bacterium]|nr:hypothetical protein [Microbacteriaceae bacterium]
MKPFAPVLLVAVVALTGCAAQPTPGRTVTTTVTATPAPVARSASDPLTGLDAWLACLSAVRHEYEQESDATVQWYSYDPKYITPKGDGFEVTIGFPDGEGSGVNTCIASGTVGDPTLTFSGFVDI